ncbi:MAG: ATP-binding cassette domain-containing protein [Actinobacteria bacterium]|nr:ATP-binding cassette domain-containing protein [Actinomycetota bacterium]
MIRIDELAFTYPGGARALDGISLDVPEGSFMAIMGANGSGKSTLLKHLNGLLIAGKGKVTVGGMQVSRDTFDDVNRIAGFVFQDPNDQIFAPTVRDDICYGPRNLGLPEEDVLRRAERAAAQVAITDLLDRPIHHLSYGQKKRLSIAGVLAMEPRMLVLDEPTASLDPMGEKRLMRLLHELNRGGMTVVMATHDVDLVPLYASQVCLLRSGRVAVTGGLREVFSDQELIERCHLRLPRIAYLFDMFPDLTELPLTVGMARRKLEELLESGQLGPAAGMLESELGPAAGLLELEGDLA